jgi:6-hydroxynicotinate 3-monooxygenase
MMSNERNLPIAVVGAGLGGTTAAIMLQRAGYEVRVYEQAPRLERVGAGIHLSPNATWVIRGIGLEEPMLRAGFLPQRFPQRQWDTGEQTFELRYDEYPKRYGAPQVIMHRGDLQQLLTSGVAANSLQLGKRLVSIEDRGASLRLAFADGTSADAGIVIGADGINSGVREILMGPENPLHTGRVAHRTIFPAALLGDLELPDCTKWSAADRYFMSYYLTPKRDEIYFVTGIPEEWPHEDFSPRPADLKTVAVAFEGFHPDVQRQIAACPQATTWPVLDRDPRQVWSGGRIVLLGDACHPMKPHMAQGAAMAMEDAIVLARCLDHCGPDQFSSAFSLYESVRFERTTRVKLQSDQHDAWMRHGSDLDWLFGYNALTVPLAAPNRPVAHE